MPLVIFGKDAHFSHKPRHGYTGSCQYIEEWSPHVFIVNNSVDNEVAIGTKIYRPLCIEVEEKRLFFRWSCHTNVTLEIRKLQHSKFLELLNLLRHMP